MFIEYDRPKPKTIDGYNVLNDKNEFYIPPHIWNEMIERFSKKEIIFYLQKVLKQNNIEYPYRKYSTQEISSEWNNLKNKDVSDYKIGKWESPRLHGEYDYSYLGKDIYFYGNTLGCKVSDNYTQVERVKVSSTSEGRSPFGEWLDPDPNGIGYSIFRCLFNLYAEDVKKKGVNTRMLFNCTRLHTYMASQFKPLIAKAIYNFFDYKKVLDFSSGWGDRLVGFNASNAESYIGIDPNTKLHPHYENIHKYCDTGKEAKFICLPAEDVDYSELDYDFAFTSPPYYRIEKYSQQETQSWKRYPKLDLWLDGFLLKTLSKIYESLNDGGRIAVNISDGKKTGYEICRPMMAFMSALGANYEGMIGYQMMQRDNKNNYTEDVFCEPIFVWSKGKAKDPKWNQDNFFGV